MPSWPYIPMLKEGCPFRQIKFKVQSPNKLKRKSVAIVGTPKCAIPNVNKQRLWVCLTVLYIFSTNFYQCEVTFLTLAINSAETQYSIWPGILLHYKATQCFGHKEGRFLDWRTRAILYFKALYFCGVPVTSNPEAPTDIDVARIVPSSISVRCWEMD